MKDFFVKSNNINRDSFVWNMAGSLLLSFQTVIILTVLIREVGIVQAGIFTIAMANANLFMTIGKYGMRYFQSSDVNEEYKFSAYVTSRWITWFAMIITSILYVIYASGANDYTLYKSMVIICMCVYKSVDVIEDVYCGMYQQKGRLDIGAKIVAIRMMLTLLVYGVALVLIKDQLIAIIITTIFTIILLFIFIGMTYGEFHVEKLQVDYKNALHILKICAPLFVGSFFSLYIGNAQKYAIDAQLSDELQAYYGVIVMPVLVISVLNGVVFNPMIHKISTLWNENKVKEFLKMIARQSIIVVGLTLVCLAGAYVLGVPVLSLMYSMDLSLYKSELLILLVGGGFLGISGVLCTAITIIRFQRSIVFGYGLVAICSFVLSNPVVANYGLTGAAILYTTLLILLCLSFAILLYMGIRKNIKAINNAGSL